MTVEVGQEAAVRVAVATLWSDPEAVRDVDVPALTGHPDIAAWVAAMDTRQRVGECVLSQLQLAERVLVDQIRTDGWARVVAVEQPAPELDPRGYPGWLPLAQLAAVPSGCQTAGERAAAQGGLLVDATVTGLHAAPDGPVLIAGVTLGTRLDPAGPPEGAWQPVWIPGFAEPLWARRDELVTMPTDAPSGGELLEVARRLLGTTYVWGGVSGAGIDCSGLVMVAWRRFGVWLPRDAKNQATVTTPLVPGTEQPGDLYFFARPGKKIHHVGIVTAAPGPAEDDRYMLHADYEDRLLQEERFPPDRTATLVGAHRVRSTPAS